MAAAVKPTNEHIAATLDQILRELGDVRKSQEQLIADIRRLAGSAGAR